jgi:hypothetical protein
MHTDHLYNNNDVKAPRMMMPPNDSNYYYNKQQLRHCHQFKPMQWLLELGTIFTVPTFYDHYFGTVDCGHADGDR